MAAFTTIAAGISLASTVGSTGASISQAVKAKREQERAEEAAKKSIQEAKDTLSVNFYEGLGIAKEPFELQRELLEQSAAESLRMGQESGVRGVVGTAGRVQSALQEASQQTTASMSKELTELEKLQAAEDARIAGVLGNISLQEAAGAQQAAADAEAKKQAATQQAIMGGVSALKQGVSLMPLFSEDFGGKYRAAKASPMFSDNLNRDYFKNMLDNMTNQEQLELFDKIGYTAPEPLDIGFGGFSALGGNSFSSLSNEELDRLLKIQKLTQNNPTDVFNLFE